MSAITQKPVRKSIVHDSAQDESSWLARNSRSMWLLASGILGFISIHPIFGFIRLALFLIPICVFCWAMTGNDKRFNILLFLVILTAILVLASTFTTSLITYDSLDPPEIDYPAFSLEAFNYSITLDTLESFLVPIFFLLLVGIPGIAIAGAIWAIIVGRIDTALSTILKIFTVITFACTSVLLLNAAGYKILGLTDAIVAAAKLYVGIINTIYEWITNIYCIITGECDGNGDSGSDWLGGKTQTETTSQSHDLGSKKPADSKSPEEIQGDLDNNGEIDWFESLAWYLTSSSSNARFDAMSNNPYMVQISILSSVPLLASALNIFFALIFLSKKARIWTIDFLDKTRPELEEDTELHLMHFNYRIFAFGLLLLFGGWMMFLNFARIYRESGLIQFSEIGYISIYTIFMITSVIALTLPRFTLYVKSTVKNTITGMAIGLASLFLMLQFCTGSSKTLSAYEYEYGEYVLLQVLNNFIFVAPAESFFFHILIPAVCLGWMYNQSTKNLQREAVTVANEKIIKIDSKIASLEEMRKLFEKETQKLAWIVYRLARLRRRRSKLQRTVKLDEDFIYRDFNLAMLFYACIIVSNFGFSMSHCVLSGVDPMIFWLSGLGIIYMVAGIIMTWVGWRFGWLSAILTHAVYNSATIIMLTILAGGI